ncbi:hypothetical protein [Sphingobacterium sp. UME9]|uniref:hypothetical protein n=1 Tax=Sphingobacterium sp. UME9 TaxID=1862316 RepID=UPI0016011DD9|nr:hypothetical protein [Sphingobacterium sp. UME9]MBB1643884.1 hypothetical protein [Sphingobacterium sp. UME9]
MKTYNSILEIKKEFQIDSDNLEIIREHLNAIRINSHPDKTNGHFANDLIEAEYHNANNAIKYLDQISGDNSLIVVEKMADLMKMVTEMIPANRQSSLEQNLDSKISFVITNFRSRMFLPKISLSVITAVMTFLFFFPGQIKSNPALSQIINPTSQTFLGIWFSLLLYSGLFWIMIFLNEEKAKRRLTLLKVDSIQNGLFQDFVRQIEFNNQFSKDDLTHFIHEQCHRNRFGNRTRPEGLTLITTRLFDSDMITMEIAQSIAEIIIARGEKNKVLAKLSSKTLSDTYEFKN